MAMNKRAQGLSINTLVLIILGVLVLVALIYGFMTGWDKIMPWIKPPNNVQDIVNQCSLACSTQAKYDFCSQEREIVVSDELVKAKIELLVEKNKLTCKTLSSDITELGIKKCSAITCDVEAPETD